MAKTYDIEFTVRPSHNDIYVYCNRHDAFTANPNKPMFNFFCDIMAEISEFAEETAKDCEEFGWDTNVMEALDAVEYELVSIVSDAANSGTWLDTDQLWQLEAYKVVNMRNALH